MRGMVLSPKLRFVERGIQSVLRQKFFMASAFDNASGFDDENLVGALDGRKPMGDHDRGAAGERSSNAFWMAARIRNRDARLLRRR